MHRPLPETSHHTEWKLVLIISETYLYEVLREAAGVCVAKAMSRFKVTCATPSVCRIEHTPLPAGKNDVPSTESRLLSPRLVLAVEQRLKPALTWIHCFLSLWLLLSPPTSRAHIMITWPPLLVYIVSLFVLFPQRFVSLLHVFRRVVARLRMSRPMTRLRHRQCRSASEQKYVFQTVRGQQKHVKHWWYDYIRRAGFTTFTAAPATKNSRRTARGTHLYQTGIIYGIVVLIFWCVRWRIAVCQISWANKPHGMALAEYVDQKHSWEGSRQNADMTPSALELQHILLERCCLSPRLKRERNFASTVGTRVYLGTYTDESATASWISGTAVQ